MNGGGTPATTSFLLPCYRLVLSLGFVLTDVRARSIMGRLLAIMSSGINL